MKPRGGLVAVVAAATPSEAMVLLICGILCLGDF